MNMLAVQAEMATWPESVCHPLVANPPADRSVVDTTIREFPERLGGFLK